MQQKQRNKLKIYLDDVKERHTTHWDLDYMSSAELDAAMTPRSGQRHAGLSRKPEREGLIAAILKRIFPNRHGNTAST